MEDELEKLQDTIDDLTGKLKEALEEVEDKNGEIEKLRNHLEEIEFSSSQALKGK